MYPPRAWLEKWAYEHPRLTLAVLVHGLVMIGFVVWLIVSDWRHT
jgi:hypothetical protein